MAASKRPVDPMGELTNLLRKLIALQLFQYGVTQAAIAKKLRININTVNEFLRGVKRTNANKGER